MRVTFRESFLRDLKKLKHQDLRKRVQGAIERVEGAPELHAITNLKKMSGTDHFYRIRVGDYRLGVAIEEDVVDFVHCLHRRDLYRYFP